MHHLGSSLFRLAMAAATLLTVGVAPVSAAPPDREPAISVPLSDSGCGFEVDMSFPIQNEYATTFFDNDGNPTMLIITGRLVATFTNPANGVSLTANISGPGRFDFVHGTAFAYGSGGGPFP